MGAHDNYLNLIFGTAYIPLLYIPLIIIILPIVGNTINSIDVLNGAVSGFIIIASIPLLISTALFADNVIFIAALPLVFVSLAFYKYHKYPSKIFPGDSGTLLLGALYGAIAIAGNSEIIGVIALLPAVMNSFLFLSSVKKVVEHRQVKSRPTVLTDDFKLAASIRPKCPCNIIKAHSHRGSATRAQNCTPNIYLSGIFLSFVICFNSYAILLSGVVLIRGP